MIKEVQQIVQIKKSKQDKDIDVLIDMMKTEVGRMEIIKEISIKSPNNWQDVLTPLDICDEMCGLDLDATHFVVLFSLEFLEILVEKRGVNPQNIVFFGDNELETGVAKKMYEVNTRIINKNAVIENGIFNNEALIKILKEGVDIMKFGKLAVIMNPPYQMEDGGGGKNGRSAKPIYNLFVETIIDELSPDYLVSINPSRWMVGGKGLDQFRDRMTHDYRMKNIIHFPGEKEVFKDVSIKGGVNYFLWDKKYNGKCLFNGMERFLDEFDIVIQDNQAISILKKVIGKTEKWLGQKCASRKPFGIESDFSNWKPLGTICYSIRHKVNYVDNDAFTDKNCILEKWKVAISKATVEGASFTGNVRTYINGGFIIEPNAICTETYLIVNTFDSKKESENFITYMKTKFLRFMFGLRNTTQSISKEKFNWVPDMEDYSDPWTDEELYKKFNLTRQEREYIESKIKELK